MLPAYFDPIRARIASTLRRFLDEKKVELARVNPMGPDAAERLIQFSLRGKMIRGCLVHLGWSIAGSGGTDETGTPALPRATEAVTTVGAAMELFHSGLLVHDDIMDRDLVRRGKPSIFQQYAGIASRERRTDPEHVGQALGICAGDVACFMAFELLARTRAPAAVICSVLELCARELSAVGIAQMQDVSWGASKSGVDVEDILRMYTHKTGRYSFSLPLLAGAMIAGATEGLRGALGAFGESIGLLFQIRDDELGLFGDERELGKPVGSDVREGKKTLIFSSLMAAADPEERRRLDGIFGNPRATPADIDYVRVLASSAAARARIEAITTTLIEKAHTGIRALSSGTEEDRAALRGLLDFTTSRRQ
ncbi:MAG: polyprenyl synthetase family protein [Spirochaetia bacterium]|jgi:geranylgeranyl diphosphate synthase type I